MYSEYTQYKDKYPNLGNKWTEEENKKLTNLLSDQRMNLEVVAYNMGRSVNSIRIQSTKLFREFLCNEFLELPEFL